MRLLYLKMLCTVLNCHVNKVVCNPSVFCNRDFEKMRAINISHNNLENIPMGCFSSFSNLEWLTISNNAKLGLHNLFHAAYGIDRTKIKHIFASNINRVQVTIPFPRNISTLLTKTSLQTFHIAYNDIKTMEQGGIYFWPRTLLELSIFLWNTTTHLFGDRYEQQNRPLLQRYNCRIPSSCDFIKS